MVSISVQYGLFLVLVFAVELGAGAAGFFYKGKVLHFVPYFAIKSIICQCMHVLSKFVNRLDDIDIHLWELQKVYIFM